MKEEWERSGMVDKEKLLAFWDDKVKGFIPIVTAELTENNVRPVFYFRELINSINN